MKNLVWNSRPSHSLSTTARAASAALAIAITMFLLSSVVSIIEPERDNLMARAGRGAASLHVAMASARMPHTGE